ncbi:hypothetical protein ASD02_32920 [Ensifer sp. Root1252]|nr:hypothetical protein ASD00_29870 [Ensifer sp. Root31]KQW50878.1 hypothetical protein ASD02_32920 [Ensifer sp. Root1252]KQW72729.1 hypothetical protein ASD03_30665 [Ensifer sp. Root127]KQY68911.1 hypothetical protein ASD52_32640 [Ensifer sp. Root142]KRC80683.1 hypothetical protein ASE32_24660 [Ensifer sp. Root231]KRC94565.1 hypothetical protein ASE47_34100 [Ensifer sp. Root258]
MRRHPFLDVIIQHGSKCIRPRGARCDAVDADVFGAEVEGDIADQVICGCLRRSVGRHALVLVVTRHRCDSEYGATTGLFHLRRCDLREPE